MTDRTQKQLLAALVAVGPLLTGVIQHFGWVTPNNGAREAQYSCCTMMHDEIEARIGMQTEIRILERKLQICEEDDEPLTQ